MPNTYNFSDVFISYSRSDSAFVRRLHDVLRERGYAVWVDWQDIPETVDWWNEIQAGIEAANIFVFIISPDSAKSDVCKQEVDHAEANNKRIVPIMYRTLAAETVEEALHPAVQSHNWLIFTEGDDERFDDNVQQLIRVLTRDEDYVRKHTRYLVRAREWERRGRDDSFLLRGTDAEEALYWLKSAAKKRPAALPLQEAYVQASAQRLQQDRLQEQRQMALQIIDSRTWPAFLFGAAAASLYVFHIFQDEALYNRILAALGRGFIAGILFAALVLFADELIQIRLPTQQRRRFFTSLLYSFLLANAFWFVPRLGIIPMNTSTLGSSALAALGLSVGFVLNAALQLRSWQAFLITTMGTLAPLLLLYAAQDWLRSAGSFLFFPASSLQELLQLGLLMSVLLALGGHAAGLWRDVQQRLASPHQPNEPLSHEVKRGAK